MLLTLWVPSFAITSNNKRSVTDVVEVSRTWDTLSPREKNRARTRNATKTDRSRPAATTPGPAAAPRTRVTPALLPLPRRAGSGHPGPQKPLARNLPLSRPAPKHALLRSLLAPRRGPKGSAQTPPLFVPDSHGSSLLAAPAAVRLRAAAAGLAPMGRGPPGLATGLFSLLGAPAAGGSSQGRGRAGARPGPPGR